AEVIVQQLQAVEQAVLAQRIDQFDDLRRGQAEDAAAAARFVPVSLAPCGELDADAQHGPHAEALACFQDERQLGRRLQHEEALEAEAQRLQRKIDEFLVLVAIADDVAVVRIEVGKRDQELGLAAALQAVALARAYTRNFLDHRALLVDLDREYPVVLGLVAEALDRLG